MSGLQGKKLAVIGAGYLQMPLVRRAREMGIRTICFAWEDGAVCKDVSDEFYPISITEKDEILDVCRREGVDGITSIASDVAVPTIAHVASNLGLVGNDVGSAEISTNKYLMREAFAKAGVPCPAFAVVGDVGDLATATRNMAYPLIVKPTDRSGSMGVTRVETPDALADAVRPAIDCSFCRKAIVEECITDMREISVEGISWKGEYHLLQITDKVTTGSPHYVELGHHQPARLTDGARRRIVEIVESGVKALGIRYGASHAELMITPDGRVFMTEIGARMGGDFIGSDLVRLSTGYDFVRGVVEVALGVFHVPVLSEACFSGVWFYAPETQWVRKEIERAGEDRRIVAAELLREDVVPLTRSADRSGYFIYQSREGRYEAKP